MIWRDAQRPIHVVIADDHPLLREGTRSCLDQAEGIRVVGAAGDGAKALQLVAEHRPDVLILDLRLPDLSGVDVTRQVRARAPEVAIVILTGYDDTAYQNALARLGIRAYLRKTAAAEEIVATVRAVAAGWADPIVAAAAAAGTEEPVLTVRERDVLGLVVRGLRNTEIAERLCVSPKTVEYHLTHLFSKLGARSRAEAIRKARELGLDLTDS